MHTTNGTNGVHREPTLDEQLDQASKLHKLREHQFRTSLLEHQLQQLRGTVQEAWTGSHGVGYAALLNQISALWNSPRNVIAMPTDRRGGRDWPIFHSEVELNILRAESYWRTKTNAQAKCLLQSQTDYVIGTGPTFTAGVRKDLPLPDGDQNTPGRQLPDGVVKLQAAVQKIIDDFVKRNDYKRFCIEAFRRVPQDGEAFIRYFQPSWQTVLRFVEPEQVRNPGGWTEYDGWTFGIQHWIDREAQIEDVCHVLQYHLVPRGYPLDSSEGEFVEAERILHVRSRWHDSNVKRGLPEFIFQTGEALDRAYMLQRNTSMGQAIREAVVLITEYENANASQIGDMAVGTQANRTEPSSVVSDRLKNVEDMEPGQHWHISRGMKHATLPASQGTSLSQQVLSGDHRTAAAAFNAPPYFLGESGGDNFASTKEHGAPFLRHGEADQDYYCGVFLKPVLWQIQQAIEARQLPDYTMEVIDIQCKLPQIVQRDPLQQTQRNQIRMQAKVMSPQQWIREEGDDPQDVIADWAQWQKEMGPLEQQEQGGMGGGLESLFGGDDGSGGGGPLDATDGEGDMEELADPGEEGFNLSPDADSLQAIPEAILEAIHGAIDAGDTELAFTILEDWVHEPTKRTQNRWKNTETGKVVYQQAKPGDKLKARQDAAQQKRQAKVESKEQKAQATAKTKELLGKVTKGETLSAEEIQHMTQHMDNLTTNDLKAALRTMGAKGYSKLAKKALQTELVKGLEGGGQKPQTMPAKAQAKKEPAKPAKPSAAKQKPANPQEQAAQVEPEVEPQELPVKPTNQGNPSQTRAQLIANKEQELMDMASELGFGHDDVMTLQRELDELRGHGGPKVKAEEKATESPPEPQPQQAGLINPSKLKRGLSLYYPKGDFGQMGPMLHYLREQIPDLTTEKYQQFMRDAWKQGVVEMKVLNEVQLYSQPYEDLVKQGRVPRDERNQPMDKNRWESERAALVEVPHPTKPGDRNTMGFAIIDDMDRFTKFAEQYFKKPS